MYMGIPSRYRYVYYVYVYRVCTCECIYVYLIGIYMRTMCIYLECVCIFGDMWVQMVGMGGYYTCIFLQSMYVNVDVYAHTQVRAPFMRLRLRYLCGCVTLKNQINIKAVMWLLFCSCVRVTVALSFLSIHVSIQTQP